MRPGHEHPVVVLTIAAAIGALAAFLVDSAGLVVLALFPSLSGAEPYLLLVSGGVGLLVASWAWRRLRPHRLHDLLAEAEREGAGEADQPGPGGIGPVGG